MHFIFEVISYQNDFMNDFFIPKPWSRGRLRVLLFYEATSNFSDNHRQLLDVFTILVIFMIRVNGFQFVSQSSFRYDNISLANRIRMFLVSVKYNI